MLFLIHHVSIDRWRYVHFWIVSFLYQSKLERASLSRSSAFKQQKELEAQQKEIEAQHQKNKSLEARLEALEAHLKN